MKNKPAVLLLAALISAAMLGGCASGPNSAASASSQSQSAVKLADRNWDSFNKSQIEKLIATYGKTSPNYNPAKPPYAVFDWGQHDGFPRRRGSDADLST